MKTILSVFLALFFVVSFTKCIILQRNDINYIYDYPYDEDGNLDNYEQYCPAVNIGRGDGAINCPTNGTYYCKPFYNVAGNEMVSDNDLIIPEDCFSQNLYRKNRQYYFNKCCYVRYQLEGTIYNGCAGMSDEQMMDIVVARKELEQHAAEYLNKDLWISELYCKGSYIVGSLFITLFSLLL